jgi:acetylornithine deacetylase/succinyl-diaminopimelate desuccinylase-like protein
MSREKAVAGALAAFDRGDWLAETARLVAFPTESQRPERLGELERYLTEGVGPIFARLGYAVERFENPKGGGPVLLAERDEGAALTVLGYGHGDVIRGQEGRWSEGLDPWRLTERDGCAWGRGVVDNKGQHLAQLMAVEVVIAARGRLGVNHRFVIEMGEENGSAGFREVVEARPERFAADVFFASDGPRTEIGRPNITLGNRGVLNFDLVCRLREGGHHSGNWGGLLANAATVLANAIASICDARGRVQVAGWDAGPVPAPVRRALDGVRREAGQGAPAIDPDWGAEGLSDIERVTAVPTFEVLAMSAGDPARPVNAIPPEARAACQLRFVPPLLKAGILPALREHLDAAGFGRVEITPPDPANAIAFEATRTDPQHPCAVWMRDAVDRAPWVRPADGARCAVLPNSGGSNVTEVMQHVLGMPTVWLPLSYAGCRQHAPDEHAPLALMREGLGILAAVWWDLGDPDIGYRRETS